MNERDGFEGIVDSLNEAMLDDASWPGTSALIDEAFRTKGNVLTFGGEIPKGDIEIFFTKCYYRGVDRSAWLQDYGTRGGDAEANTALEMELGYGFANVLRTRGVWRPYVATTLAEDGSAKHRAGTGWKPSEHAEIAMEVSRTHTGGERDDAITLRAHWKRQAFGPRLSQRQWIVAEDYTREPTPKDDQVVITRLAEGERRTGCH